jgi:hypothetical protein
VDQQRPLLVIVSAVVQDALERQQRDLTLAVLNTHSTSPLVRSAELVWQVAKAYLIVLLSGRVRRILETGFFSPLHNGLSSWAHFADEEAYAAILKLV